MQKQLALIEARPTWKLDRRTREIGLRGVAQARAALRLAAERRAGASASAQSAPAVSDRSDAIADPGRRTAA